MGTHLKTAAPLISNVARNHSPDIMATIIPNEDFDAEAAAQALKDAMKGLGTDEELIIGVMISHDTAQRTEIQAYYKTAYGQDLIDDLKSELGGNFEDGVLALMNPPRLFDAKQLRKAMKGGGTDDSVLIEILCARSNAEIAEIVEAYQTEFEDRKLEEDIENDTSGNFRRLLVSMVQGNREEGEADPDRAAEDAQRIYDAGEGQFGTDESELNVIFATRSYDHLRAVFEAYEGIADGKTIEEAISSECSGTLEDGFKAIVKFARDPQTFYAERLYNSMKGAGTDDDTLIRLVVGRSEIDLEDVKEKFYGLYETSLYEFIDSDCGGDYKRLLLGICARKS